MKLLHAIGLGLCLYAAFARSSVAAQGISCPISQTLIDEERGDLGGLADQKQSSNGQFINFVRNSTGNRKEILITYRGNDIGSPRIVANVKLKHSSSDVTLFYFVRFSSDFQFVLGGKLPGLGPDFVIGGGADMKPSGWSVRPMFREGGTIGLYIYHQDMASRYGRGGKIITALPIKLEQDYLIELRVRLNSSAMMRDGAAILLIDGTVVEEAKGIRFYSSDKPALISKFLFHTFFGGSGPQFAPRLNGKFVDVHATFDRFLACDNQNAP